MKSKHTTLRVNAGLMRKVKAYARDHDLTMTAVMERALTAYLAGPASVQVRRYVDLPSSGTGGLRPGVNLDSNSQLLDIMDGIEPGSDEPD